jgi:hypothetical protein
MGQRWVSCRRMLASRTSRKDLIMSSRGVDEDSRRSRTEKDAVVETLW